MKEYDFVVIGSGIAGISFALKAAKHGSVAVITKRKGTDTNTAWAQGGIACVTSDEDSFELHVRDTLEAGAGLCDEAVVRTIVTEGPERIHELAELGLQFDERLVLGHRELDLGKEGGHSKRRVLHVRDATGKEIEETLLRELGRQSHVRLLENHMAVDLITAAKLGFATEDRCFGVYVLDEKTGKVETIRSDRIVLATGGCGKVYLYTTNPDIATGDGVAMAWRAGVEIANMEFIQFHPTCLFHAQAKSFLISEAVRGEGGILRNNRGEDFMKCYDARGSLAPRDIVARAIDAEIKRKMRVFGYHAQIAGIYQGAFSTHLPDLPALRDRHVEAGNTSCAGSALSMRRNQNRREWRDEFAWVVCDRRGGVHRIARSKSSREQFAAGRPGGSASCGDRLHARGIQFKTKNFVARMEIGKRAGH